MQYLMAIIGIVATLASVVALAIWTAGKLGVPLAAARQEILAILRGL